MKIIIVKRLLIIRSDLNINTRDPEHVLTFVPETRSIWLCPYGAWPRSMPMHSISVGCVVVVECYQYRPIYTTNELLRLALVIWSASQTKIPTNHTNPIQPYKRDSKNQATGNSKSGREPPAPWDWSALARTKTKKHNHLAEETV